jgi:hypothetical protein
MQSKRLVCVAIIFVALSSATPASARDTEVSLSARAAAESELGRSALYNIPFYMKGQPHPKVASKLLEIRSGQSTRGMFRSDEDSCNVAFLSAIKVLQERAQESGADAIVNVVSITRNKLTESATDFRCVAGTAVVHVGLRGDIVKLEK